MIGPLALLILHAFKKIDFRMTRWKAAKSPVTQNPQICFTPFIDIILFLSGSRDTFTDTTHWLVTLAVTLASWLWLITWSSLGAAFWRSSVVSFFLFWHFDLRIGAGIVSKFTSNILFLRSCVQLDPACRNVFLSERAHFHDEAG